MKCPSCEAEWQPGKSASVLTVCPFCGASLAPEPKEEPAPTTIEGVLRSLVQERGAELYKKENASRFKALLSDLAADFPSERKILGVVITEGVQERLLKAQGGTEAEKRGEAAWCRLHLTEELGMAENRATEAVNMLAAGLGWEPPLAPVTPVAPTVTAVQTFVPQSTNVSASKSAGGKVIIEKSGEIIQGNKAAVWKFTIKQQADICVSVMNSTGGGVYVYVTGEDCISRVKSGKDTQCHYYRNVSSDSPVVDFRGTRTLPAQNYNLAICNLGNRAQTVSFKVTYADGTEMPRNVASFKPSVPAQQNPQPVPAKPQPATPAAGSKWLTIEDGEVTKCAPATTGHIVIPDGVTKIGYRAFYGCTSLVSVTIPDGVTEIGYATFSDCTSLVSVIIPDSVTEIGKFAFYGCTSLVSVTIPNNVIKIGYRAFYGCTSLVSVSIPDSVIKIENRAFDGCTSLASVTIPGSIILEEGIFLDCNSLHEIHVRGDPSKELKKKFWLFGEFKRFKLV